MKFKEKYIVAQTWLEKIKIIALYHKIKLIRYRHWSLRRTAKYFGVSLGLISENLSLFHNLSLVSKCKTRKDALIVLGKKKK